MNIIDELKWRGLLKQVTSDEKIIKAEKDHSGVYCGFDPTADSLHVGHLIPIILLERFNRAGFKPIALIGGGTGMIGDPSFKSAERVLQTQEQVDHNVEGITKQLKKLIPNVTFKNNAEWLGNMKLLDFLRDVGKDFTLGYLLAKENIAKRIETGLSVTEFAYTMLQAYDFYNLYTKENCHVQIGGSDQWGNITSGTDYIAHQLGTNNESAGLTIQLLTKKDGKKFGKTESGALWLDPNKTSEYEFYQFWLNQDDADVVHMLKFLTFLDEKEINELEAKAKENPKERIMQKALAKEVTTFVHGEKGFETAVAVTDAFFNDKLEELDEKEIKMAFDSIEHGVAKGGDQIIDAIVASNAAASKREAREFLASGAITIKGQTIDKEDMPLTKDMSLDGKHVFIKRGKRKFFGIELD